MGLCTGPKPGGPVSPFKTQPMCEPSPAVYEVHGVLRLNPHPLPFAGGRAAVIRTLAGGVTREVRRRLAAGGKGAREPGTGRDHQPVAAFAVSRGGITLRQGEGEGERAGACARPEDPSRERGTRAAGGATLSPIAPHEQAGHSPTDTNPHVRRLVSECPPLVLLFCSCRLTCFFFQSEFAQHLPNVY